MILTHKGERTPLRLWPGVAAVVLQWALWRGIPLVAPDAMMIGVFGLLIGALAVLLWWLFFSRAPWLERLGMLLFMVAAIAATKPLLDPSIQGGMMGMMLVAFSIPLQSLALVLGAVLARRLAAWPRRAVIAACILVACAVFTLFRTGGITAGGRPELAWRWSQTDEQKLLAAESAAPRAALPSAAAAAPAGAAWPGFRGPRRDGVVTGLRIKTDWTAAPPARLWRRPVGPGWSSFAAAGSLVYTQEQRGDSEVVSAYNAATGEPVWLHRDAARFYESNAGAGPRGTPSFAAGRLYSFGATGIVNALDASTGAVLWTHNAAADTGEKVPTWGFSSSPLVVDDEVVVAASGRLAAYGLADGKLRWSGPAKSGGSYSSPHLLTIGGTPQVLMLSNSGAIGVAPADGKLLWRHPWSGTLILQPALTQDGDVLLSATADAGGIGTRRLAVSAGPAGWSVKEVWTSNGLKPYFNDFVVHKGHAYGFDGSILACIELQDGRRKWKGGRYGNGQLLLLADQDLLIVVSEEGEIALVSATPSQFTELARIPAIEGKTWNHPAVAGDILLIRNSREMAAFRLPRAGT